MSDTVLGFAPSFYYAQNTAGLGVWIASGSIDGVSYNGQLVNVPKMATTQINVDANGNIVLGPTEPGLFPIAVVVAGQVVTSGNTAASTPWGGVAKLTPAIQATYNNATYNDGILSITDIRPTGAFAF